MCCRRCPRSDSIACHSVARGDGRSSGGLAEAVRGGAGGCPGRAVVDASTRQLIATAREAARPVILVPRRDDMVSLEPDATQSLPAIDDLIAAVPAADGGSLRDDGTIDDKTLWRSLADLLPSPGASGVADAADEGASLPWNEVAFSRLLADAVARLDHHRSQALIAEFTRQVAAAGEPYPAEHARNDLKTLRRKRQFTLMRAYAAAALSAGTRDFTVRRQYAQSLIELGKFDTARQVLEQLVADVPADHPEASEAHGLLGRLHKQLYVNAPGAAESGANLQRALELYGDVFRKDPQQTWQGINTASLLVRAGRDGVTSRRKESGATIASDVLMALDDRRKSKADTGKPLDVWDLATRVEALVALGDVDEAQRALDEYLYTPTWTPSRCPRPIGSSMRCCSSGEIRRCARSSSGCGKRCSGTAPPEPSYPTTSPTLVLPFEPADCCSACRIRDGTASTSPVWRSTRGWAIS